MAIDRNGWDGRDRWGEHDERTHEEEVRQPRRPAPGKIASTSLIGNPDPPRWYQPAPGKRAMTMRLLVEGSSAADAADGSSATVQARGDLDGPDVHAQAARGLAGGSRDLPHRDAIQQSFGHHDVSGVRAHVGGAAGDASAAMGARAYASGDAVAFAQEPDLHLAAHEAAHVVQQRGGVRLSGGVGRAGDAYERHADEVADLVVRGESAEPVLDQMAHRGAQGGPAVQRDEEYMTTDRYIAQHQARLGPGTVTALDTMADSLGAGILAMYASLQNGVEPVLRRLREAIGGATAEATLRTLCSPVSLESCVDRGRDTTRTTGDLITTGSDKWSVDVGTAIADAIARNLRQSLGRIVGRYAAARSAAQNAAWKESGECDPAVQPEPDTKSIASSHPVDRHVIDAACAGELFQIDLAAWRSFHPDQSDATSVAGVRTIMAGLEATSTEGTSFDDHGRFYLWIRGTIPDATAEEVAQAYFGSTEYAHLLTVKAPPRYAFSATHVWGLPQHLQDRIVGQSPELQRERERRKSADTGEPRFIGFMVPRDFVDDPEGSSTAATDPSAGLAPKMADEVALAGATSAAPLPEGTVRDKSAVLSQMGQNKELVQRIGGLAARFEELGMMAGSETPAGTTTKSLSDRIDSRRDQLKDADDATVLRWDVHARAQQEVLGGALAGLLTAHAQADQMRQAAGGSDDVVGDYSVARSARLPLQRVAMKFFAAAAYSDTPDSGRERLDQANQASQLYPTEMMELILQEVSKALSSVRNKTEYTVVDMQVREAQLRRKVAQLRQQILAGSPEASALMQEIFASIQDLQSETVMIANMDTIDATWAALGDMADSFGVWGDADEKLRQLQGEAVHWKVRWNLLYREWTSIAGATGPDAEKRKQAVKTRFDEMRADPKLADFLGRTQTAMQDAGQRALIAKLIALLAIVVLTMGAGTAVAGFVGAGGLGWGAVATTAAVVVTEAAVFTTLHTAAFVNNPTLAGVAVEFGYNVLLFGALRGVSAALRVGRLGTFLSESGNLAKAELAGQGVVMGSMTLARAEIENRLKGGNGISAEEAATITAESTAMFVAMVVLGRAAQPMLQKLEGAAGNLGSKIRIANEERAALVEMAKTVQDTKDLKLARELMARDRESLKRDREALEELLRTSRENPQALRDQGMTDTEIKAMSAELGSGVKRMHVAELMRGVENVGGDTFVASRQEMAAHLANHQQAGATIREGGVDRITGRRWFEVDHGEGLKLRIFEGAGESARPGMPGQAPPTEAQAAELRAAAKEAEAVLKARDDKVTKLVMESSDPVVADTVIIGSGQAGTLAHATVPGRGRAIPGAKLTEIPGTFNVAVEGSTFAKHGDFPLGQGHGELSSPAMTRQPGEFTADHSGRTASSDYVRSLTMTALDTGMATVRARVEAVEANPRDGSWPVERPLRITLTGGKHVYVNTLVGAMGLGPPRPAGFAGEAALKEAGKLVYAQESLALPGGGGRILVIGGGASGMWACEAALKAGARSLLWSGRADPRAEVPPEARAALEKMGLTGDQISAFHTAYNSRNKAGFEEVGGKIELTTATLEKATLTRDGKVRIESSGGVIEVDGVVVSAGQVVGMPKGMEQMRFRIVTAQHNGVDRLIALDAIDAKGNLLGIRLTGAQIMNRGMARFIEGGAAEVQRYQDLVTAVANDPTAPPDSRGVPGSAYQSNISVPAAMESLPTGGTYRPGQAGDPTTDEEDRKREAQPY